MSAALTGDHLDWVRKFTGVPVGANEAPGGAPDQGGGQSTEPNTCEEPNQSTSPANGQTTDQNANPAPNQDQNTCEEPNESTSGNQGASPSKGQNSGPPPSQGASTPDKQDAAPPVQADGGGAKSDIPAQAPGMAETFEIPFEAPSTSVWNGKAQIKWKGTIQFSAAFLPKQANQIAVSNSTKEGLGGKIAHKWALESIMKDIGAPDILTKAKFGAEAKLTDKKGISIKAGFSISGKYGSGEINGILVKKEPGQSAVYGGLEFVYTTPQVPLEDFKDGEIDVVKIGVAFKATATLEPKFAKIIADELIQDAEKTVAESAATSTSTATATSEATTVATEGTTATEALSASAVLDVAIPAALAVVAIGTVAGVADMFVQRSQNKDMRVGVNTARASLMGGLYAGLSGAQSAGGDALYQQGWDYGHQAYQAAIAKLMQQPNLPPPDEITAAAQEAAKKAAGAWKGVAQIDNEIRWAFFRDWVANNHGYTTFKGAAQDAVLSCFGIANEDSSGPHMSYWVKASSLPDAMKS